MKLQLKKLNPEAKMPSFAYVNDAGMDVYALEEVFIPSGTRAQIHTGIAVAIPEGNAGLIWDKSGLSQKSGLKTLGGVIDAGYRGEIIVGVVNTSGMPYTVKAGEKIAQLLIQPVLHPELVIVDDLDVTERGEAGFGSTGK